METPTIDKLAKEGVKLENYYVQPLCSPTRSTIMTGRYPSHTGIGPNVDRIDYPYGVPAREVFFPELLREKAGYSTHMVGKWHLGACHEGYHPTFRGFDSYVGYLAGGQGYYSQSGDRNSTCPNELGPCLGEAFKYNYSSQFFANECKRIIESHAAGITTAKNDENNDENNEENNNVDGQPLFLYLAFQSVHNPYDVPPIDVNATFSEIFNYDRRIYRGMIKMMDDAISKVVDAFKANGLWNDTVVVFTADNGGIGVGSNYPLRGTKVFNWEGGIKAVGFVRGTNNPYLKPLPKNTTCTALMHSTDWFLTFVEGLAGIDDVYSERKSVENDNIKANEASTTKSASTTPRKIGRVPLPLDGYNQWKVLQGWETTNRTTIFHQVPVGAKPINTGEIDPKTNETIWTTSMCMHLVDNRTYQCSPFGVTGGALRHGDYKLLITHAGPAAWRDTSTYDNAVQILPGGIYPNGSTIFVPSTTNVRPIPYQNQYFLFDISNDPTESFNLAESMPDKFSELLQIYNEYATKSAKPALDWRWGFTDPTWTNNPQISNEMRHGRDPSSSSSDSASTTTTQKNIRTSTSSSRRLLSEETSSSFSYSGSGNRNIIDHSNTIPVNDYDPATAGTCMGPFLGSKYCSYGHEWECYIQFSDLEGHDIQVIDNFEGGTIKCQSMCASTDGCLYWVLFTNETETPTQQTCKLKSDRGKIVSCSSCVFGPKVCPS